MSGFDPMPVLFVELAEACAPTISSEILAAVVSIESGLAPLAIRVNSDYPLSALPRNMGEAADIVARLIAEGQSVDLGLGGISPDDLARMGMGIADGFDPCQNLKVTAQLLTQYRIAAARAGFDGAALDAVTLRAYFGRGDPKIGEIVGYDRHVQKEKERLKPRLAELALGDLTGQALSRHRAMEGGGIEPMPDEHMPGDEVTKANQVQPLSPGRQGDWDVFASKAGSSVLAFPNNKGSFE
ncbi:transglycosylase SLT domain-containing protein [Ensifer sp. HO-A22]|uniref:Transglycosylase SLT domain-containing protein n=1 Tax=Ensifer oleiphilus TaxID=2742698 RepID=A0A7Y6Q6A3_9HYPH|nr:transglycosylase SLT domain-containing protein [Ensifer oleiphilus]